MMYGKLVYPADKITRDVAERVRIRGTRAMGNIAKHTDLSAELPSARAYVDVPLEGDWPLVSWPRAWPDAYRVWPQDEGPDFEDGDDDDDEA